MWWFIDGTLWVIEKDNVERLIDKSCEEIEDLVDLFLEELMDDDDDDEI